MKKLHLLNIGFPKTGTTWLFRQIEKQSWFDQEDIPKEVNIIEKDQSFNQYVSKYSQYNYSANFNPNLFKLGRNHIGLVNTIKSSLVSIILRNPYEQLVSYYYFSKLGATGGNQRPYENNKDLVQWTEDFLQTDALSNYCKIIDRWISSFPNTQIFLYDDLQENPVKFFERYRTRMDLPRCSNIDPTPIFVGKYKISPDDVQSFRSKFKDKIHKICLNLAKKNYIKTITMEKWLDDDRHL